MGSRGIRLNTPGLFSPLSAREPVSPSAASLSRHVLPKDLAGAIAHLRGSDKQQVELEGFTLIPSKINAVRAAFKAGIKASQIARQFGIARADVRRALLRGRERAEPA